MIPINRYGNCGTDLPGTGSRPCEDGNFGDIKGFNLHPKTFSLDTTADTLDAATWKNKIKSFDVIPFLEIHDFTQDTPENEVATSSIGREATIRDGLAKFTFMFTHGGMFHKKLYPYKGDNRWDISIVFDKGLWIAKNAGKLIGFDGGRFDVPTLRLQQGTDPQSSSAIMQLIDARQVNLNWEFITWEQLGGVDLSKIDGIIDAVVEYVDEPTTSNTFSVSVANKYNLDDAILALDEVTSWRLGGTQATSTTITGVAYDADNKTYVFTLSAPLVAGDTVQPTLISAGGYDVAEDELGGLYKGQAVLYTVA